MNILIIIFSLLVAFLHYYFLALEMFLWTKPRTIKAFGLKNEAFAKDTKVLAANQGLYNGFMASGIVFAILSKNSSTLIFFITCIIIAGLYGAYSTGKIKLFYIQSIPAIITLIIILIN
ncbi:DUF1304 domain-containing protein [Lacinutrix sp. 5H-3-7-4]|uniref:DUF1304 domain-containing protein n=1 Tax=Lacinutrix sp. (strain 5H-3-7-4) TaxID=983544 RepID=UPI00020A3738|nr:DUF1304 domain-containing protein [Lacinutrix sp. 5H-3-7-4]AEH01246.1 protein of unknown function DUF1304 [Lacinutrix sp. 5H-3-7-4]